MLVMCCRDRPNVTLPFADLLAGSGNSLLRKRYQNGISWTLFRFSNDAMKPPGWLIDDDWLTWLVIDGENAK